jgi:O-antigen/teichoic acid export membrane protein
MALRHDVGRESRDEGPLRGVEAAEEPGPWDEFAPGSAALPAAQQPGRHGRHSRPGGRARGPGAVPGALAPSQPAPSQPGPSQPGLSLPVLDPLVTMTEPAEAAGQEQAAPAGGPAWRQPRKMFRRLGWGLCDQAVSSLTNFAVSLYVARELGAVQYGAFSLAYVTYSFVLNASRGLATDPLMVRFSGTDVPAWRKAVASCTGTAASVGLVAGAACLVTSLLLSGTARASFLALGLTLPGLMLQDSWRYAFFALGRGGQAFLNDCVWALAMAPALIVLKLTHHADVFWFVLAWGAAAWAGAAIGPLQARVIPRLPQAWEWITRHRDLGPRYLAENCSLSGAAQLRTYAIGGFVGLAAVGYVQASSTMLGPFLVIFMGISLVTVPEAARVLRRAPRHLRLYCLAVSVGLSIAALSWGVILLIALPRGLGHLVLPTIWQGAYPLILPLTIAVTGSTAIAGATSGLRALGAARRSLRAMVITSILYLAFGVAGAAEGGALGTMQGIAVANWIGVGVWWWQLRSGLRESPQVPLDGQILARRSAGRHRGTIAAARAANPRSPAVAPMMSKSTAPASLRPGESEGT